MAFNNGFPMGYTYPAYQPQQNGMIWVQGESGAKSYLTAPNTTVVLFDSESQTIYLKSADATGLPNMRILDYTIRDQKPNNGFFKEQPNYATKSEMDALRAELEQLKAHLKGVKNESTVQRDEQ